MEIPFIFAGGYCTLGVVLPDGCDSLSGVRMA